MFFLHLHNEILGQLSTSEHAPANVESIATARLAGGITRSDTLANNAHPEQREGISPGHLRLGIPACYSSIPGETLWD